MICTQHDCPYFSEDKDVVFPEGDLKSPVVVIGEAPGANEQAQGRPFVGVSGKLLRRVLRDTGFDFKDLVFTNTCWCRPPDNEKPKTECIIKCVLAHKLAWNKLLSGNKLVLLVGSTAQKAFCEGVERGSAHRKDGHIWVGCYHPAYVLRNQLVETSFIDDIWLAHRIYTSGEEEKEHFEKKIVYTNGDLEECVQILKKSKRFGFDLETTGLDPFTEKSKILLVSFAIEGKAFAIPVDYGKRDSFPDLSRRKVMAALREVFSSRAEKVAQNGKFDILWLLTYGIEVEKFHHDTMVVQYLLGATEFESVGLKKLAWSYYPEYGGYESKIDIKKAEEASLEALSEYGMTDAWLCYKISCDQEELMKDSSFSVWDRVLKKAVPEVGRVEFNGLTVDEELVKVTIEDYEKREADLDKELRTLLPADRKLVLLSSTAQIADLLFNVFGLAPVKVTAKGASSVDKEVLGIYAEQGNVFCQKLLELRKLAKLRSTYLENYVDIKKRSTDCRVRSTYFFGTKGGRMSSSNPNMQNLPKDMRRCFRSRYRDGVIIDADFKQAELRVFAIYSKDETLIKMLNEGEDLHRIMVARAMSQSLGRKVGPEDVTDAQRQRGKGINFGLIYGRGPASIAKEFKLDEEEAETFHKEFFSLFKRAKGFHDKCIEELTRTGFISSLLGRKRYLANFEDNAAIRRALNFPIQSLASDVCLWTLCRIGEKIRNEGLSACIIATVHDSIVIDSDIDCAERVVELVDEASQEIPELFEGISKLPVGFEVDVNVGFRWGEYE